MLRSPRVYPRSRKVAVTSWWTRKQNTPSLGSPSRWRRRRRRSPARRPTSPPSRRAPTGRWRPLVQTATNAWATENTTLDTNAQTIAGLEKQLGVSRANQLVNLRRWTLQRQGVLSAINLFCDGSSDTMATFGVAVASSTRARRRRARRSASWRRKDKVSRAVAWQWFLTPQNRYGFMVQHATNVADATTYSQPMACSKRSFKLLLQTPGTTISLRVMALDPALPTGQTDWSGWAPSLVSA